MFHQEHRGLPPAWHQPALAAHVGIAAVGVREALNRQCLLSANSHAHHARIEASGDTLRALRVSTGAGCEEPGKHMSGGVGNHSICFRYEYIKFLVP